MKKKVKKVPKVDTTNEDPTYWEGILKFFGLGERQLGLKEEQTRKDDYYDDDEL